MGNGYVVRMVKLNNLEKLPTLIDDRLAQVDNDMDGLGVTGESWGVGGAAAEPGQVLLSQIPGRSAVPTSTRKKAPIRTRG